MTNRGPGAGSAVTGNPASPEGRIPPRVLMIAIAAFFVVSFILSWLRAVEFQTSTWDQGLYQQALWMTTHGRPFYETADVETGGYGSLLDVHSVFLFYLLVPVYSALPFQTTLFAVQSAVVAFAAYPIYLLTKDVSASSRWGLMGGLVYLAWTPVLSSTLYDFHPEAFLPVELFTAALFWERGRYRWGFLVAAVAFVTLELAPVLTFFLGLFALTMVRPAGRSASVESSGPSDLRAILRRVRDWLRQPRVAASLGLMAVSAVAYAVLLYLRVDLLTSLLGTYPLPASAGGYVIGSTPSGLQLSWANVGVGLAAKLEYWLLAVALLAFVPLLAPRALLITVPWFAFTMLSANLNYVTLGFQYGFIAASSLLVAFAYGLPELRRWTKRAHSWWSGRRQFAVRPAVGLRDRRWRRAATAGLVVSLIAINLALTPLNPAMDNHGLGSAYRLSYAPNPGDGQVDQLAELIPSGATVLASDNLFPLVANDANAYSFSWWDDPVLALPFNATHLPAYVLVAQDRSYAVTPWIADTVYNSSAYGVRGVVWGSDAGVVLLFEQGYRGTAREFGSLPASEGSYYGRSVLAAGAGVVATVPNATFANAVESVPGSVGTVWSGPLVTLAAGRYALTLSLHLAIPPGIPPPAGNESVLSVDVGAFGLPHLFESNLSFTTLNSPGWRNLELNVSVGEPAIEFAVKGSLLDPSVRVTLNYLSITTEGPT